MTAKEFLASKQGNKKKVEGWQPIATPELLEEYAALKVSSIEPQWVKINSEDDLPKTRGKDDVYLLTHSKEMIIGESKLLNQSEIRKFWAETCSYWMPITKPQPPKD